MENMKVVLFVIVWVAIIAVLCVINKVVCDLKAEAEEQALRDIDTDKLMTCPDI